jgi:hypothetical protein
MMHNTGKAFLMKNTGSCFSYYSKIIKSGGKAFVLLLVFVADVYCKSISHLNKIKI